jgi:hypothetical protein
MILHENTRFTQHCKTMYVELGISVFVLHCFVVIVLEYVNTDAFLKKYMESPNVHKIPKYGVNLHIDTYIVLC